LTRKLNKQAVWEKGGRL